MALVSSRAELRRLPSKLRYYADVLLKLNGVTARECPICGRTGRFGGFGHPPRYDAECPNCMSLERHRLLCLAMQSKPVLSPTAEVLHFAPEQSLTAFITSRVAKYVTADLEPGLGHLSLNLEQIALPDQSFDIVIANHVLEHVNDRTALRELWRILRPGGVLVITVPLIEGWDYTYEDHRILAARDRELHFGQWDHLRYYGRDFRERLKVAGFAVTEFTACGADAVRFGLLRGERVFFAHKR
jgi:SAM-dependent methyltransferase